MTCLHWWRRGLKRIFCGDSRENVLIEQEPSPKQSNGVRYDTYQCPSGLVSPLRDSRPNVMPAIIAVYCMLVPISPAHTVKAASTHSKKEILHVSARVLPALTINVENRFQMLDVTEEDVTRGYIDLSDATSLQVRTNSSKGYSLLFENGEPAISQIEVYGLNKRISFHGSGAVVSLGSDGMVINLVFSYRFIFAENVRPGAYPWPLTISLMDR